MSQNPFIIIDQSSASSLFTYTQSSSGSYIELTVYNSAILKHQSLNNGRSLLKKNLRIYQNCYILLHPEKIRIKLSTDKKQIISLMTKQNYHFITELRFQSDKGQRNGFTLQRKLTFGNVDVISHVQKIHQKSQRIDTNSLVFYSLRNDKHNHRHQQIKDNDILKFGKQIYFTHIYPTIKQKINLMEVFGARKKLYRQQNETINQCKICLMKEGLHPKDYVISPCKCSGSCSSIHIQCLKKWIQQKTLVKKSQTKLFTYDISKFQCEICKEKYPQLVQVQESYADITPEHQIQNETLVLHKIFPLEENKISHFINLQNKKHLAIGRSYVNDLMLEDMSISRNHAIIYRDQNCKYFIRDRNAKFGTLIALKQPIQKLFEAVLLTSKINMHFKLVKEETKEEQSENRIEQELTEEEAF